MSALAWLDDLRLQAACTRGGSPSADTDRIVERARAHLTFAKLLEAAMHDTGLSLALVGGEVAIVVAKPLPS
jgi:hypothetical protein